MSILSNFLLAVFVCFSAWSRTPLELNQEIIVPSDTPDVKQEAFKKAIEDATLKLISETVGNDALEKKPAKVKQILSKSEKYILFIKGSTPESTQAGTRIKIEMKISLDNFEALLREAGLLQTAANSVKLIPILEWTDEKGTQYAWWVENPKEVDRNWTKFITSLTGRLKSRNIKMVEGFTLDRVPPALRKHNLSRTEQLILAKQFDASLILFGDIKFVSTDGGVKAQLQTEFVQVQGDKILGSGQSTVGPSKEGADSLATKLADNLNDQVRAAQGAGKMNLSTFKIVLQGSFNYQMVEQIRRELLEQVLEIRALKDRVFSPDEIVFDAESNKSTAELAQLIRKAKFTKLRVDAQDSGSNGVILTVKSL